jgi:cell division protein FtsB
VRLPRLLWPLVGLVALLVFLAAAVFPTRTYLHQRDDIAAEEAKVRVLSVENEKLNSRVAQLHTDAEIERLAREQYNLVKPGEEAYAILPGPDDRQPTTKVAPKAAAAKPSWWARTTDAVTFWN